MRLRDRLARRAGDAPRGFVLEDYKRWFPRTGADFLRYLKRYDLLPVDVPVDVEQDRATVALVVVPWVSTPVPWYSVMLGVGLARRGRRVVLLWDDTGFPELFLDEQNRVIAEVLDYVGRFVTVIRVGDRAPAADRPGDAALLSSLTSQNVTWIRRGAKLDEGDAVLTAEVAESLARSLPLVRAVLAELELDLLVCSGGVYGTSGLFRHEAESRGVRVATYDTDRSIPQLCVSGVAAQNGDVARAFEAVWSQDDTTRRTAIETARSEYRTRTEGSDTYGFQTRAAGEGGAVVGADQGAVLIPLNVEWDTAALGRHVAFADSEDWLTTTVAEILAADLGPVIVRQHPSERRQLQRSNFDVRSILHERFGADPRLRFVAAEDPVSSYDLLRAARLVLPYVSTIAIEAAAIGKPVLISGSGYYQDLGFVYSAGSRGEYLELLHRGLRGELPLLPDQSDRAWICYYLTAVKNRTRSDFTSHPVDFWEWCGRAPEELFADVEVANLLTAIDADTPLSLVRHRISVAAGTA